LLLACLPGEQHEIGLLLFSLAAHEVGFRLIVLGADMPLTDLAGAAAKARCDAIVLSGAIRPDSDVIEKRLPALVTATDCPVFVGGTTSVRSCDAILDVGAVPIGEDIQRGIRLLSQRLNGNGEAEDGSAGRG
jgi:cobalamin-dependent methionine synthase I